MKAPKKLFAGQLGDHQLWWHGRRPGALSGEAFQNF